MMRQEYAFFRREKPWAWRLRKEWRSKRGAKGTPVQRVHHPCPGTAHGNGQWVTGVMFFLGYKIKSTRNCVLGKGAWSTQLEAAVELQSRRKHMDQSIVSYPLGLRLGRKFHQMKYVNIEEHPSEVCFRPNFVLFGTRRPEALAPAHSGKATGPLSLLRV